MKKCTKFLALLLALSTLLVLVSCNDNSTPKNTKSSDTTEESKEVIPNKDSAAVVESDDDPWIVSQPGAYRLSDVESTQLMDADAAAAVKPISVTPVEVPDGQKIKVGYSQMEVNSTWRVVNSDSIKKAFNDAGYELLYRDAQSSIEKQVRDIIDLLNEGVDYLIIAPKESEGLAAALDEAKKRNVPVILSDREAAGTAGVDFTAAILGDFVDTGYKAAVALRQGFGEGEKITAVEITATAGSSIARDQHTGFSIFMEEDGNMEILASADGNSNRTDSLTAMQNIIQAYKGQFNAVFCHNDDAALVAVQALKDAGLTPGQDPSKGEILIVGMIGYRETFDAIIAGDIYATVECTATFGPVLVDIINRLQSGGEIPTRMVMPCKIYDPSNVEALYHESFE